MVLPSFLPFCSVLGIDSLVLTKTLSHIRASQPASSTLWSHIKKIRDPTTLAVLMEDSAACTGILVATAGIGATQVLVSSLFISSFLFIRL